MAAAVALAIIFGIPQRTPVNRYCTSNNMTGYLCDDRVTCIPASSVCNGISNCANGEDENSEICTDLPKNLPTYLIFKCGNPQFWIYIDEKCNDINNCGDCSDEVGICGILAGSSKYCMVSVVVTSFHCNICTSEQDQRLASDRMDNSAVASSLCLNEYHLFFLLAGAFMGYSYSLLYVVGNMNYVSFPNIQQNKYLRFKGTLPLVIKHSAVQALYSVRNYCITYFFLGGHPHNWSALSGECLTILNDLTQKLIAYQEAVSSNGRIKPQSVGSDKRPSSSGSSATSLIEEPTSWQTPKVSMGPKTPGSVFLRSSVASPFTPDLGSPFGSPAMKRLTGTLDPSSPWHGSVQSPHVMRRGPKLWTSSSGAGREFSLAKYEFKHSDLKGFFCYSFKCIYLPEASSQALFAESQAHIWALEGLSHLVAASYTEDRFGVVQTTLPDILGTMLTLQEAVDKHFKLPHASSKPARTSGSLVDTSYKTLRFALRASLKTAIYRITTTFGEHLNAVQVSAEHRKRLQQFLEYKE
ncbi:Nucleoporin NDC1 [Acipenser ruthenus]|uniref:Nucleoporin NDC1 n=1 Tax=Acipenser ruthenus TaxID=7906 RepID=A0A662YPT3_ACIRT|nr:Nucleoporin NDC1 [Acipenser ruthenus]